MKFMMAIGQYDTAEQAEERRKAVLAAASPGTDIEFAEVKADVFELTRNAGNEMMTMVMGPQYVARAREAQERGFDAFLPWCTLDMGVDTARTLVDIPVVPMGRAGLSLASLLATRIAVFVYMSHMVPGTWRFIRQLNFENFVTSVRAVDMNQQEMIARRDVLKERLISLGKRVAAEEDAEVIVPLGVSLVPVYCSPEEISRGAGVPVLDLVAAQVKFAEMLVSMGVGNSRKAYPRPAGD